MYKLLVSALLVALFAMTSCKKDPVNKLRYFEIGIKDKPADWRDSSFVVATSNAQLLKEIEGQLGLPVDQRKIVNGGLAGGSGGYNKNGSYYFKWHFKENDWKLTDISIEIYDGRPYSDLDLHPAYWLDTMTRYSPWNSYIRKEVSGQ